VASKESIAAGTPTRPEEMPAVRIPATAPTVETPAAKEPSEVAAASAASQPPTTVAASTPATVLAPARVTELPQASTGGTSRNWLAGALLLTGVLMLGWLVVSAIRQRVGTTFV